DPEVPSDPAASSSELRGRDTRRYHPATAMLPVAHHVSRVARIHAVTNSGESAVESTTAVEMNSDSVLYSAAKMVISTPTGVAAATTITAVMSGGKPMAWQIHQLSAGAATNFSSSIRVCGRASKFTARAAATCAPRV